jgi:putative ABC transport system substrate-binding protein
MKTGNGDGQRRHRDLLKLCASALFASGAAGAWPFATGAQQPATVPRVGWIWGGGSAENPTDVAGFRQGLRELGYIKGQNVVGEDRFGEDRHDRLADLAAELVQLRPDVLVALGDFTIRAVKSVTTTIPVVLMTGDPVGTGFVTSLARPGGNITGVSMMQGLEREERREQLRQEAHDAWAEYQATGQHVTAEEVDTWLARLEGSTPTELRRVFTEIARDRPDAIMAGSDAALTALHQLIVELVNKSSLPAMYPWRDFAEAGGLMAYGADLGEVGRRMADDVHEILNGAKPGDIPIYQAARFQFIINLKAAEGLGLKIPPALLATADEVIE